MAGALNDSSPVPSVKYLRLKRVFEQAVDGESRSPASLWICGLLQPNQIQMMLPISHNFISIDSAMVTMKKYKNNCRDIEHIAPMELDALSSAQRATRSKRVVGIMLSYALIIVVLFNLDTPSTAFYRRRKIVRRCEHSITGAIPIRRTRVLWGIFSGDFKGDDVYRNNLRLILSMDPVRVCSLDKYIEAGNYDGSTCELIYTFVAGALKEGPTERLAPCESLTVSQTAYEPFTPDFGYKDMTLLNIKENMEHGKSQSWLAHAACLMNAYDIDYVAKTDTDTIPLLDKYFEYTEHNLPPAPYNINILSGSIVSKDNWPDEIKSVKRERAFRKVHGENMHVYAEGQWYLLSRDLAESTVKIAANKTELTYLEYIEDHDVSTMAFISVDAMHLVFIPRMSRHWIHPVKQSARHRFRKVWQRELNRTAHLYDFRPYLDTHPELTNSQTVSE